MRGRLYMQRLSMKKLPPQLFHQTVSSLYSMHPCCPAKCSYSQVPWRIRCSIFFTTETQRTRSAGGGFILPIGRRRWAKKLYLRFNHNCLLGLRFSLCASIDAFRLPLADLWILIESISHPALFSGASLPQGGMTCRFVLFSGRPPANEKILISVLSSVVRSNYR